MTLINAGDTADICSDKFRPECDRPKKL